MKTRVTENLKETSDIVTLTPTEGAKIITGKYNLGQYDRTLLFRGSPGIGKTTLGRAAATQLALTIPNFQYIEINPTMPADEVGGLPDLVRNDGKPTVTDYALPNWFPTDPDWKGLICLDDGLQGDRLMQQTLANLIQAKNLRRHPLPRGAMLMATGNRMEDKAGVTKTLSHFGDRMCWINIETDPKSWLEDFAIPHGIDPRIIAYIMMDNSKLDAFDPNAEKSPTPRTWEAVSGHLAYLDTLNTPAMAKVRNKFAQALLAGELGMGEATKFWAFCERYGRMPDIDKLLADPNNSSINFDLDVQYALVVGIANKMNSNNFENALTYIDRIGPDLTTLAVKLGAKGKDELLKSKAFQNWVLKNQDVIHIH